MIIQSNKNLSKSNAINQLIKSNDIIKGWKLDYNLSCVINNLESTNHSSFVLENLKRAEWYLNRALLKARYRHQKSLNTQPQLLHSLLYPPQEICEDWELTDNLCSIFINIYFSRGHQSNLLKEKALKAALECLREEIAYLSNKENYKVSFTGLSSMKKTLA